MAKPRVTTLPRRDRTHVSTHRPIIVSRIRRLCAECAVSRRQRLRHLQDQETNAAGAKTEKQPAAGGPQRRLVFLTNGDDPFWDTCRAGMDQAAEELKISRPASARSWTREASSRREKQLAKLEQLATQSDVAAVAVSPVDAQKHAVRQRVAGIAEARA